MKKTRLVIIIALAAVVFAGGCGKSQRDERVTLGHGVGSSGIITNPLLRPISYVISDLIGQGLVIEEITQRAGKSGFLEVFITLNNQSYRTKKFQYKFEWLDEGGGLIDSKTSVWLPYSISGNATSAIKGVAPRADVSSFRVITRKAP